jgi:drug/metabolite transporter (DMT)-like permease
MYYPKTVPQGLVWLLLGLCGGGTWPALRQAIKSVDFEVFNLGFIVSMSGTGIALLSLLSLPPTRDPPPPPFGPGDWDGLWEALVWDSVERQKCFFA